MDERNNDIRRYADQSNKMRTHRKLKTVDNQNIVICFETERKRLLGRLMMNIHHEKPVYYDAVVQFFWGKIPIMNVYC